eukprot:1148502-Pelagomonas_calceolata.AAC.7
MARSPRLCLSCEYKLSLLEGLPAEGDSPLLPWLNEANLAPARLLPPGCGAATCCCRDRGPTGSWPRWQEGPWDMGLGGRGLVGKQPCRLCRAARGWRFCSTGVLRIRACCARACSCCCPCCSPSHSGDAPLQESVLDAGPVLLLQIPNTHMH